ncbi:MAG: phosphopantothenate--cysteine ligase, partial [Thermoplasmata archaeon]|nr:phosphopantothenate--cysteine ligase [Thermoplasmata archaeon]
RGKLSSGMEKLELSLEPAPKVLPILRSIAPDATLVGFKLEVGLSDDQLVEVARTRLGSGVEDLVVANDLERVTPDDHPAIIIAMKGEPTAFAGQKSDLAAAIFDAVEAARE